ncbi:MAG TPA: hypothetical protein VLZ75_09885 [Chitinophagales bacterium]|nr:hypothetical protein [Chitinophagales bacterium]
MPQLIILSLQILYFCLAWSLVTFKITPFSDAWNYISGLPTDSILPEWAIHTHYLFALIFITSGITFTLRLKVMNYINSTALIFLVMLLISLAFSPELYVINLIKYSYIVFIPYIFQKIIVQDSANIQRWIKTSILLSLLYATYHISVYLFKTSYTFEAMSTVLPFAIAIIGILVATALYSKRFYKLSLHLSILFLIASSSIDFLQIFKNAQGFDYNMIPILVISWSMILFTFWVRKMSVAQA